MTRLVSDDIHDLATGLPAYDRQLKAQTGSHLRELALKAAGWKETAGDVRFDEAPTAVVSVTSGLGTISGFADAVAAILHHIGFHPFVTSHPDVGGLVEAYEKGARMVLMADDLCFSAINLVSRRVAHNGGATGRGFVTALQLMAGSLKGKKVLVIGCGPVGQGAARALTSLGACVGLLDKRIERAQVLAAALGMAGGQRGSVISSLESGLADHDLILEATPVVDVIGPSHINPRTIIAAPGVPCGVDRHARAELGQRLIHDPLQIGVATMAVEAWSSAHNQLD